MRDHENTGAAKAPYQDGQKDAYAHVSGVMTPRTDPDDQPSTLAVVGVAFASLIDHGMAQDIRVERMVDEITTLHRGNRYLEDRLRHKDSIMHDMTVQLVRMEDSVASFERTLTALEAGLNRRDELLTLAHALIKRVDTNRMAPNSERLQWRRDRTAFFNACKETEPPTPVPVPSQVPSDDEQHAMEMQQALEDKGSDAEYERIVQEAREAKAPAPDDATVARLQEEYHAARRTLRDARTAQRLERKRQYGVSMMAPAVRVPAVEVDDDEDEYEGPPSGEQAEDEEAEDRF